MSVSAERVALASQAVLRTFEQTSVAWQAIPHWDTQNPGQARVRSDQSFSFAERTTSLPLNDATTSFTVTLAQATAPTPDSLLGAVMARTVELARGYDEVVLTELLSRTSNDEARAWYPKTDPFPERDGNTTTGDIADFLLGMLLDGRTLLEDNGYRGGSCLLVGPKRFRALNRLVGGVVVADEVMRGGGVTAAYRMDGLEDDPAKPLMVLIGRRQDLAGGSATHASAGEEPVDLAVSVPPSLEVVGDTAAGTVELAVRLRYAIRLKDDHGVVVLGT